MAVGEGRKYSNHIRNNTRKCEKYNCFGAHTYAHSPNLLPKNAIIYNLEQLYDGSPYAHPLYLILLKDRVIWDYSKQNIEWLKQKGVGKEIKHVGMNYAPTLEIKKKHLKMRLLKTLIYCL